MATRDDWRFVTREEKRPLRTIHDSRRFRFHVVVFASWWKREKITDASHRAVSHVFLRGGEARPNAQFKTRKRFFRPRQVYQLAHCATSLDARCPFICDGVTRAPAVPTGAAHVAPLSSRRPDPTQPWVRHPPRARGDPRRPRRPEPTSRVHETLSQVPRFHSDTATDPVPTQPPSPPPRTPPRASPPRGLRARAPRASPRSRARLPARVPLPATTLALAFPPRSPRARASRRRRRRRRRFPSPAWTPRSRS
jgi:hypothetical protein